MDSTEWAHLMNRPAVLYRLYDASDQLLYIGIARDIVIRFQRHASDKPWWPEVAWHTAEWFETRREASGAEDAAIHAEKPKYNVVDLVTSYDVRRSLPSECRPVNPTDIACPKCPAAPRQNCRTRKTNRSTETHAARWAQVRVTYL